MNTFKRPNRYTFQERLQYYKDQIKYLQNENEEHINRNADLLKEITDLKCKVHRAHLDKAWNQPTPLPSWISYPEHKPTDEQKYDDFFVLYLNPRHINKLGLKHNAPLLLAEVTTWIGDKFLSEGRLTITHYMPIPKLPKEYNPLKELDK